VSFPPDSFSARPLVADLDKMKSYLTSAVESELRSASLPAEQQPQQVLRWLSQIYTTTGLQLDDSQREQLFQDVIHELLGYGPIQVLFEDPEISEIMVNGPKAVFITRKDKATRTDITFQNDEHVLKIIARIIAPSGWRVSAEHPIINTRLPDGSLVNVVIPPVAIDGPAITIRKSCREKLSAGQLIRSGSIPAQAVEFLQACVAARLNILIAGGAGSGRSTLLNVLSGFIPSYERIVIIEDAAELQLQHEHFVRLETKPPQLDGTGGVNLRDLVRNTLHMQADRMIVGECFGGEVLDLLHVINTGHEGALLTLQASTPYDALARLETMAFMSGVDIPTRLLREQITSAVDLIIQLSRFRDGTRRITQICEVAGMEGDRIILKDLFNFERGNIDHGALTSTGIRPLFAPRLEAAGFELEPFGLELESEGFEPRLDVGGNQNPQKGHDSND
jgi:pilus assembly protein CpaF